MATEEALGQQEGEGQALVIYSFAQSTNSLAIPERCFTFYDKPVKILQQWQAGGKGGTELGFGASVYDGAFALSYCLQEIIMPLSASSASCERGSLIELGCGPGLVSIVAAMSGGFTQVIATDGDELSVQLTASNINNNKDVLDVSTTCKAMKALWGNEDDMAAVRHVLGSRQYADFIVASDCVAVPYAEAFDDLLLTIDSLLNPLHGVFWLCYTKRHAESECVFFDKLDKLFDIELLPQSAIHPDFHAFPIAIYRCTRLKSTPS